MDNAQKAIMIGVGLFITIIIISAVLLITNMGTDLMNNSRNQLSNISTTLQNQVLAAFDGKTVSGSEVITACQQYANSDQLSVVVYTTSSVVYRVGRFELHVKSGQSLATPIKGGVVSDRTGTDVYSELASPATMEEIMNPSTGVSASQTYNSFVVKDPDTGVVVGIAFVRKGVTPGNSIL